MSQTLSMNLNCVIDEVNELLSVKLPIYYAIDRLLHLILNDKCLPCVQLQVIIILAQETLLL